MRQSVLPRWLVALLVAVATWLLPSPLRACADTIPLQAQQTATRTVALSWNPTSPEVVTTILRRYPGEQTERTVATTTGSSYIDHHGRAVCDDTVYYVIRQTVGGLVDQGFAAVNVIDMDPTAAAAWGVVSVDEQQQTVTGNPYESILRDTTRGTAQDGTEFGVAQGDGSETEYGNTYFSDGISNEDMEQYQGY